MNNNVARCSTSSQLPSPPSTTTSNSSIIGSFTAVVGSPPLQHSTNGDSNHRLSNSINSSSGGGGGVDGSRTISGLILSSGTSTIHRRASSGSGIRTSVGQQQHQISSTPPSSSSLLTSCPPPLIPPSQHYFRPIHAGTLPHLQSQQHYPIPAPPRSYSGRIPRHHHHHHDDFDLTSDSDAISSPTSSIVGPPPQLNLPPSLLSSLPNRDNRDRESGIYVGLGASSCSGSGGLLRGPSGSPPHSSSSHLIIPNPPSMYNGNIAANNTPNTNQPGWNLGMFSPPGQSGSSGPLRFDESSFLGTSDACSSPETGSLPRSSKLTKRKRPPRPPPRRLKSEDYTLPEEDDDDFHHPHSLQHHHSLSHRGSGLEDDDDDDPHLRHLIQTGRCIDYGSWPRDSPSPAPSSAAGRYQQQLAMMTMSMGGKLEQLQAQEEKLDTAIALSEIRTQLQELTKSVESCQDEVTEVKRDMIHMKTDINLVHHVKEELEDLRDCIDRIDDPSRNRKSRLLEQGLTFFLSFAIFAAVLGMLQFGYNTGVINAPKEEIEKFMKQIHEQRHADEETIPDLNVQFLYSVIVSMFAIGGMLGGFGGGIIANKFGRKGGLLLNNLLGIGGGVLMWLTMTFSSFELLILGRFVIGVHCGTNTILVPMYVSEIAPLNLRGALGTVNQLAVTIGLLVSQILGIQQLLGTQDGWPTLLGLAVVPAILQMLLLPMCPESPRYLLITKQREEEARKALRKLRASQHIEEDVEEMRQEIRAQQSEATISMLQLLRSSSLRMPLCIAVVMQLSQQLSGINAVLYYSTDFFKRAGLEPSQAKFATIGIGAIMFGMTLVSIMLVDRAGRRTLHLWGLGGMFVFSLFITIAMLCKEILDWISYLAVVFTLAFVVFFAVGPGSIPWMITAELFSQGPRHSAMAIAALTNWFANWLVSILFPSMQENLTSYVFLPFSALLGIFWTFTYRKVPETKNKTFEEISALFKRKATSSQSDEESNIYGMLNCVNTTGHPIPEHSALIQDEKPPPDSLSGRSSPGGLGSSLSPPGTLPPPPVPFQIPPYPQRYLDDNGV